MSVYISVYLYACVRLFSLLPWVEYPYPLPPTFLYAANPFSLIKTQFKHHLSLPFCSISGSTHCFIFLERR